MKIKKKLYPLLYELFIFLFFLFLSVMFFWPALSTGKSYIYQDIEGIFAPYQMLKRNMFLEGYINLWNPHIFSGVPYEANMGNGPTIFYPFSFIYYFFPISGAVVYQFILHFTLAGYFMYLFAKSGLGGSRIVSIICGTSFAFCGFFVTHLVHTFVIAGCWLPLIFLFSKLAFEKKSLPFVFLAGIFSAVLLTSGLIQVAYYIYLSLGFFWLWYFISSLTDRNSTGKDKIFIFYSFPLLILTAILVSAVQLFPFIEFIRLIFRGKSGEELSATFCMTWYRLITFIIPDFHGRPDLAEGLQWFYPKDMKKYWFYWETCAYTGILMIIMSVYGLFYSPKKIKWFFLSLFILSLLMSLGNNTPLYGFFKFLIPYYKKLRSHGRFCLIFSFCLSSLSVLGLNMYIKMTAEKLILKLNYILALLSGGAIITAIITFTYKTASRLPMEGGEIIPEKKAGIIIFALLITLITVFLFLKSKNIIKDKAFLLLLLTITITDLALFGYNFNGVKDPNPFLAERITGQLENYRTGDGRIVNLPLKDRNRGQIEGFEAIQGYEPLALDYYIKYLYYSQNMTLPDEKTAADIVYTSNTFPVKDYFNNKMINLLNGKYINFTQEQDGKELSLGIYENVSAFPRASLFYHYRVFKGKDKELLALLNSMDFYVDRELLLSENIPDFPENSRKTMKPFDEVSILKYTPDLIEMEVNSKDRAILFLSEIYYPGWKASVDDIPEKIYRADYIFRAIPIREAGMHKVKIYYSPLSYRAGKYISIISILSILIYFIRFLCSSHFVQNKSANK